MCHTLKAQSACPPFQQILPGSCSLHEVNRGVTAQAWTCRIPTGLGGSQACLAARGVFSTSLRGTASCFGPCGRLTAGSLSGSGSRTGIFPESPEEARQARVTTLVPLGQEVLSHDKREVCPFPVLVVPFAEL